LNSVGDVVLLRDDAFGEHVDKLFEEIFHVGDGFFVAFHLDTVPPSIHDDAVGMLDEPEVLVHVSEETRQQVFVIDNQTDRGCFHCVYTAMSPCP